MTLRLTPASGFSSVECVLAQAQGIDKLVKVELCTKDLCNTYIHDGEEKVATSLLEIA